MRTGAIGGSATYVSATRSWSERNPFVAPFPNFPFTPFFVLPLELELLLICQKLRPALTFDSLEDVDKRPDRVNSMLLTQDHLVLPAPAVPMHLLPERLRTLPSSLRFFLQQRSGFDRRS